MADPVAGPGHVIDGSRPVVMLRLVGSVAGLGRAVGGLLAVVMVDG